MPSYGYNFPWSGRVGGVAKRCIYCGDDGPKFRASSFAARCLGCIHDPDKKPIPELEQEYKKEVEKSVRQWCDEHDIDYDATIENYRTHLGPPVQERDDPIPGTEKDYMVLYTVYKSQKGETNDG